MIVPLFQRPYVWSKERQWEPLWQDIERLTRVASQGSDSNPLPRCVHCPAASLEPRRMPDWSVIDGQQRLTTLQILFDSLHAQLDARGLTMLAAQIEPLIDNPTAFRKTDEDQFKVWPTNNDRAAFESVMSATVPVNYSESQTSSLLRRTSTSANRLGRGERPENRERRPTCSLRDHGSASDCEHSPRRD